MLNHEFVNARLKSQDVAVGSFNDQAGHGRVVDGQRDQGRQFGQFGQLGARVLQCPRRSFAGQWGVMTRGPP